MASSTVPTSTSGLFADPRADWLAGSQTFEPEVAVWLPSRESRLLKDVVY